MVDLFYLESMLINKKKNTQCFFSLGQYGEVSSHRIYREIILGMSYFVQIIKKVYICTYSLVIL